MSTLLLLVTQLSSEPGLSGSICVQARCLLGLVSRSFLPLVAPRCINSTVYLEVLLLVHPIPKCPICKLAGLNMVYEAAGMYASLLGFCLENLILSLTQACVRLTRSIFLRDTSQRVLPSRDRLSCRYDRYEKWCPCKHFQARERYSKHIQAQVYSNATARSAKRFLHELVEITP
jgi:hypothetical protein